jgi:hypothetical protein
MSFDSRAPGRIAAIRPRRAAQDEELWLSRMFLQ